MCIVCCSRFCRQGTLDPAKVKGKIVACFREDNIKSVGEGQEVLSAGGAGMILQNQPQQGRTLLAEPHVLTGVSYPTGSNHGGTPSGKPKKPPPTQDDWPNIFSSLEETLR